MPEIWISYASIHLWDDAEKWTSFFEQAQRALGSPLTYLDTSDPLRRKVRSLEEAGEYASKFIDGRSSTSIFGRFEEIGVEFTIDKHRDHTLWPNYFTLCTSAITASEFDNMINRIKLLFGVGKHHLSPFYGYCDDLIHVTSKKPKRRAVDIRAELVGIFWMTCFSEAYVEFFGRQKFSEFPHYEFDDDGGVIVCLSADPSNISPDVRSHFADLLGGESFVDVISDKRKPPGRFALTLEELSNFELRQYKSR